MLADSAVDILSNRLKKIKHNKRRLNRLQVIREAHVRECERITDDGIYIATMCVEARNLVAAAMPVSKSPVWPMMSVFLREQQRKQVTRFFDTVRKQRKKAAAKLRRNTKSQTEVNCKLMVDDWIIRAMLSSEPSVRVAV